MQTVCKQSGHSHGVTATTTTQPLLAAYQDLQAARTKNACLTSKVTAF